MPIVAVRRIFRVGIENDEFRHSFIRKVWEIWVDVKSAKILSKCSVSFRCQIALALKKDHMVFNKRLLKEDKFHLGHKECKIDFLPFQWRHGAPNSTVAKGRLLRRWLLGQAITSALLFRKRKACLRAVGRNGLLSRYTYFVTYAAAASQKLKNPKDDLITLSSYHI